MIQRWIGNKIRCGKCDQLKEPIDFYRNNSRGDGYSGHCKDCAKQYPQRNKQYEKKTNRVYALNEMGTHSGDRALMRHFYTYRNQVKRRKVQIFELTLDEFFTLTRNVTCHYCGGLSPGKDYVGIDRVDSSLGYIFSNCVPCCIICNMMKNRFTLDEFLSRVKKIYEKMKL